MITPNFITVSRIVFTLIGVVILLLQTSLTWRLIAYTILTLAALSDILDGWLARKRGMISDVGAILDPIADKFFILGVMSVFSYLNLYSFIWVLLIGLREIIVTVVRLVCLKRGLVIAAEKMGKLKTIFQMISLGVSAIYLISRDNLTDWPRVTQGLQFGNYLFLFIAVFLTLLSGASFFKNLKKS